ncbi:hypothetical protein AB0M44_48200 [Streptosporangium subroseum]|uniref:hypothetical protein n=1 Tax=Streptosporangium subroseum TaxID=106412 RepID=UPI0034224444
MTEAELQLAALERDFPAWRIACVADLAAPIWYGFLRTELTDRQRAAGACPTLMRSSPEALASALSLQIQLVRKMQPWHNLWRRFIP